MYLSSKLSLTSGVAAGTVAFDGRLISAVHSGGSPAAVGFAIGWWLMVLATVVFTMIALAQLVRRPRPLRP
jgi:hypothetical protein